MNQSPFQKAAGISARLCCCWFPHIDAAMKEFGITAVNDQLPCSLHKSGMSLLWLYLVAEVFTIRLKG